MKKRWITVILFLLFLIEGSASKFFSPDYYGSDISFVPRFVLALIIYISIFKERHYAMWLGIGFGLLYDLTYGNVLGINTVAMGTIGYFSGWVIQFFHATLPVYLLIETFGFFFLELFTFGIKSLYRLINIPLDWAVIHFIIPSILFNLVFLIIIYKPMSFLIDEE